MMMMVGRKGNEHVETTKNSSTRSNNMKSNVVSLGVVCVEGVKRRGRSEGEGQIQFKSEVKRWLRGWRCKKSEDVSTNNTAGPFGFEDETQGI
jgi:hypothetical protein